MSSYMLRDLEKFSPLLYIGSGTWENSGFPNMYKLWDLTEFQALPLLISPGIWESFGLFSLYRLLWNVEKILRPPFYINNEENSELSLCREAVGLGKIPGSLFYICYKLFYIGLFEIRGISSSSFI